MPPKLGIVAGGGALPGYLARHAREQGRDVFIVALERQADPATVAPFEHAWVRIGAPATAIAHFRDRRIDEIVMVGPVRRPSLVELMPDALAARLLSRGILRQGDDGLLAAVVEALEQEGFRVVGVQDILGGILAPEGTLTDRVPDAAARADIARGVEVLEALRSSDVGQAVVVQEGLVLGIEAIEGTDALVERAGVLRRDGPGPVLVKLSKTGQETRADLPTIGPDTISGCAAAGFSGVAVEAERSLIVDRDTALERANRHGIFIEGLAPAGR